MTAREPFPWKHLLKMLKRYALVWLGSSLLFTAIGIAYTLTKKDQWEASQPLLVRDEVAGAADRLGKFSSQTDLIAAQETILEVARNREVVEQALKAIGPASLDDNEHWPSLKTVDTVASEAINVRAPKTSEFGKTEVVYLSTRAASPQRAEAFCDAMLTAITEHLRSLRTLRAEGIVVELRSARDLAQANLDDATKRLQDLESSVGIDLSELRGLSESLSGEVITNRLLGDLQTELQQAELKLRELEARHDTLLAAHQDPQRLLISDSGTMNSLPTLQRLKTGVIDAQLEASKLAGRLKPDHPQMVAAALEIETIHRELRTEILSVARSMEPEIELARQQCQSLRGRQEDLQKKLAALATIRTEYSQLVADVDQRTRLLGQAEAALTEGLALRASASNTSLLSPLGPPRCGEDPVGPGGSKITVAASATGLLLGLGCVFLVAPGPSGASFGRRWSDARAGGRRMTDTTPTMVLSANTTVLPFPDRRQTTAVPVIAVTEAANAAQTKQPDASPRSIVNNDSANSEPTTSSLANKNEQPPLFAKNLVSPRFAATNNTSQSPVETPQEVGNDVVGQPSSADSTEINSDDVVSIPSDNNCPNAGSPSGPAMSQLLPSIDSAADRTELIENLDKIAANLGLSLPFEDVPPQKINPPNA